MLHCSKSKALFFKNIGVQENEVRSRFHQMPETLTAYGSCETVAEAGCELNDWAGTSCTIPVAPRKRQTASSMLRAAE
jgi:hypothetical protein